MKLIITRPLEDGEKLSAALRNAGHECFLVPLIEIHKLAHVVPERSYQAICITSANGLRSVEWTAEQKNIRVLAVGPQSRDEALRMGFKIVEVCGGDVDAMVGYITRNVASKAGPLLYPSGTETSGDLEGKLEVFGFAVERVKTYDARPASKLPQDLKLEDCDGVLLYSARTATIWGGLNDKPIKCFCLSQNVAEKLPLQWEKHVAPSPTDQGMRDLLERISKAE